MLKYFSTLKSQKAEGSIPKKAEDSIEEIVAKMLREMEFAKLLDLLNEKCQTYIQQQCKKTYEQANIIYRLIQAEYQDVLCYMQTTRSEILQKDFKPRLGLNDKKLSRTIATQNAIIKTQWYLHIIIEVNTFKKMQALTKLDKSHKTLAEVAYILSKWEDFINNPIQIKALDPNKHSTLNEQKQLIQTVYLIYYQLFSDLCKKFGKKTDSSAISANFSSDMLVSEILLHHYKSFAYTMRNYILRGIKMPDITEEQESSSAPSFPRRHTV